MAREQQVNARQPGPTLAPVAFAIGVVVVLVGLIINLEAIAPVGAAITVLAAAAWIRGSGRRPGAPSEPTRR
jgi:hypothetical protein